MFAGWFTVATMGLLAAATLVSAPPETLVKAQPPALIWDAESKSVNLTNGETNYTFTFSVTNVSKQEVTITKVQPSCGCTVAKTPANPWVLKPGDHGSLQLDIDLRGKYGTLAKNALVNSTAGFKVLQLQINLPAPSNLPPALGNFESRIQNIHKSMADRQAIFKGDCASCHAEPAKGKSGQALYYAVCSICHESAHRASMVPDLANLPRPLSREDWIKSVTEGKPGTLMAAFSKKADHGPLSDEQIKSLVDYLVVRFPNKPASEYAKQPTNTPPPLPLHPAPGLK